ncbi:MAG: hypothetical protein ACRD2J_00880 [Thermoanaerobaculia bacterium]
MKKALAPLVLLVLVAGCASGDRLDRRHDPDAPEIALAQVGEYGFALQYTGPISISFEMAVRNPSDEPIRIRHVKFSTVGSGAYYVRTEPHFVNQTIPPGKTLVTSFSLPAYAQGGSTGSREPVTLRGIAYFEDSEGSFQKVFFQSLRQDTGAF